MKHFDILILESTFKWVKCVVFYLALFGIFNGSVLPLGLCSFGKILFYVTRKGIGRKR